MRRMFDAAYPESVVKFGVPLWEAVAGYIGGNTPNVWTKDEWNLLIKLSGAQFALPIYTRSNPLSHDPVQDARIAIDKLNFLGVEKNVCMALDLETAIAPGYVKTFDQQIVMAGWKVVAYGSKSTIFLNGKPSGGHWVADWPAVGPGRPHLYPGSAITQWAGSSNFGGAYDPNLVADTTPLWRVEPMGFDADQIAFLNSMERDIIRALDHNDVKVAGNNYNHKILSAKLDAITGAISDTGAKLLAAIDGVDEGMTDVQVQETAATMAATLSASLPAAFVSALKEAL